MNKLIKSLAVAGITLGAGALTASASSHREAPAIAEDQYVDNTDVYAFISPNDANKLVIVADYVPLLLPTSGPNFYKFSDHARYEVHIDNNGDAVPDIAYRWTFSSQRKNGATFLYNTGAVESLTSQNLNVTQTYRLEKVNERTGQTQTLMDNVPVAPWNVGAVSNAEQVALRR
jgi:hypothetical protein